MLSIIAGCYVCYGFTSVLRWVSHLYVQLLGTLGLLLSPCAPLCLLLADYVALPIQPLSICLLVGGNLGL